MESITDGYGAGKSPDFSLAADRLLGRVNGTIRFLAWGSRPMGSLLGGDLGNRRGGFRSREGVLRHAASLLVRRIRLVCPCV